MGDYRKLEVWECGRLLVRGMYELTASFPRTEQYGLTAQLRRAAVSVVTNIAEGSGRNSDRDFARFIAIALGSATELGSLLLLAQDLGFATPLACEAAASQIERTCQMLAQLRRRLLANSE
ncbi:MAG: four helix bundle protein [Gemmatimonadales bacterium]|nr:four helix bundle protein [Gemmatimonadales bacterium]